MNAKDFRDFVKMKRGEDVIKLEERLLIKGERLAEKYLTLAMAFYEEKFEKDTFVRAAANFPDTKYISASIIDMSLTDETFEIGNIVYWSEDSLKCSKTIHFNQKSKWLYVFERWIETDELLPFLEAMEARGFDIRVSKDFTNIYPIFKN